MTSFRNVPRAVTYTDCAQARSAVSNETQTRNGTRLELSGFPVAALVLVQRQIAARTQNAQEFSDPVGIAAVMRKA